jgi:hypothetical protein
LRGTNIATPFRLSRYIDEQAFRFNTRDITDGDRFEAAFAWMTQPLVGTAVWTSHERDAIVATVTR